MNYHAVVIRLTDFCVYQRREQRCHDNGGKRSSFHKDDEATRGETCATSGYFIRILSYHLLTERVNSLPSNANKRERSTSSYDVRIFFFDLLLNYVFRNEYTTYYYNHRERET